MKIAVTYDNGNIFQHFGHTEFMKFYEIEKNEIKDSRVVSTMGQGHGALAEFLSIGEIDTLICGGIGTGAINALAQAKINVISGVQGNVDEAVKNYLAGKLVSTGANCNHHSHGEGHTCGSHGCGSHGGCGGH